MIKLIHILLSVIALLVIAGCQTVPRDGRGTYTFADGGVYVGEFRDRRMHGRGTITQLNGDKYVGEFRDNTMHGRGIATFGNRGKYVGEFKNGRAHGQGKFTHGDGRVENGIWENDKLKIAQTVTPKVIPKKSPPPKIARKSIPKSAPPPANPAHLVQGSLSPNWGILSPISMSSNRASNSPSATTRIPRFRLL